MQEFIDNIKGFADFIGALIHLLMLPIKLFNSIADWILGFPYFVQLIIVFFLFAIMWTFYYGNIYEGPRGGFYRINKNGNKSYDVPD